ncbi:ankyrin repeat-containing domain protein [Chaetomium strumarium]|uniref:Ankyrin repeat-containing domain protein n=1 Tax=Chaetomium strumarium TaxID=1170767 RepID=A0AAJ0GPH6_9PEZI|nr:ankyrin repeat-containing domain protein [Chaetomium strumarium]
MPMDFELRLSNTDPTERRRLRNRLAQRKFRLKKAADRAQPAVTLQPAPQPATHAHNLISSSESILSTPHDPSTSHVVLDSNDAMESFLPDVGVPMMQPGFGPAFDFSLPEHNSGDLEKGAALPPPQDQVLYESQPDSSLRILSTAPPSEALDGWIGTLHIAAQRGNEGIMRMLLQKGKVDCNEQDSDGRTPLMYAVIEGHEAMVRALLAHGARVGDVDRDRRSALHLAILHRRESVLRVLLSHDEPGLDLDAYDVAGWTALHMAVERDFAAAVELLLQNGANLDTKARKCHLMGKGAV